MIDKTSFGFVRYMLQYGIYLGCLVGFFGAIPLALMILLPTSGYFLLIGLLFAGVMGVIVGVIYGCMAGFISGAMMHGVTRLCFREVKRVGLYRVVMGVTTLVSTSLTFLIFPLFSIVNNPHLLPATAATYSISTSTIPVDAWYALWLMALVFAVYASQRVATYYLREVDAGKGKVKAGYQYDG